MAGAGERAPRGQAARRRGGELALRILSGVVMGLAAIGAAYAGGRLFLAFCGIAALGIWWEWASLSAGRETLSLMATGAGALIAAAIFLAAEWIGTTLACLAGGALLVALLAPSGRRGWTGVGILYAGAMLVAPVVLRSDPQMGFRAVVFLFAVVWATDTVAYFAGRTVGGPKLAPRLSPNKTWSGAVAGIGAAVAAALAVAAAARLGAWPALALMGAGLSIAAQAGDLFESAFKRQYGAKDASRLIPGHGGLMDRLDGFIAAALIAVVLGVLRGGTEAPARGLLVW
jgi:phosphatidate cytidylyltransferase